MIFKPWHSILEPVLNYGKKSLTKSLILKLTALVSAMVFIVFLFSFFNAKKEINLVFDAEMGKSAKLVYDIAKSNHFTKINENLESKLNQELLNRYSYEIHLQAWKEKNLIYNSGEKIRAQAPSQEGFADVVLGNEKWRSFAFFDQKSQIKILVLEKIHIREELIREIVLAMLAPFASCIFFLIVIIISIVKKELKPLETLSQKITDIPTGDLKKFTSPLMPSELQPFLNSFQGLLKRLDESIEAEKRFTDYAAHELNTPLTAIKLQTQFLIKNYIHDQHQKNIEEQLQDLLLAVNRAAHLVDQLLTLSRISANQKSMPSQENFCLYDLVLEQVEALRLSKNKASDLQVKILSQKEAVLESIFGSKIYFEILLKNLLNNACKYSAKGSKITIELSKKTSKIHLKISNFGDEVLPSERKRIFDNFFRSNHSKNTRGISGSGLGLGIAKKIVELHRGNIAFSSIKSRSNDDLDQHFFATKEANQAEIFINIIEIKLPISSTVS